jgi:hypothetical protein
MCYLQGPGGSKPIENWLDNVHKNKSPEELAWDLQTAHANAGNPSKYLGRQIFAKGFSTRSFYIA